MKILISDVTDIPVQAGNELKILTDDKKLHHCIGCFGCWIKTPGKCVIKDDYMNMGEELAKCETLILISHCTYGGLSPFVKNILDRSISYISPYFKIINNETHHQRRYDNTFEIVAYFYGMDLSEREKELATDVVNAFAVNFHAQVSEICFCETTEQVKELIV